jgi:hypothetical protein
MKKTLVNAALCVAVIVLLVRHLTADTRHGEQFWVLTVIAAAVALNLGWQAVRPLLDPTRRSGAGPKDPN